MEIFDYYTEALQDRKKRCIGNIVIEAKLNKKKTKIIGFENHGGQTFDIDSPFGSNVIATYLHGPLLAKNPELADYIIRYCLSRKYQENIVLEPLNDELENACRLQLLNQYLNQDTM